ncbi:MAG: hypothetical protein LVQ63_07685 [Thermoplasmatales archaeon]|nr:hypothetical protein [Thermoplasmatales archaeon]
MLLKELDKKLDTECKVIFNKDDRVFSLSKAMGLTFQVFLELEGNDKYLLVYIPKENLENEGSSAKYLSSTTENEGYLISTVTIEESLYELLTSLDEVQSSTSFDLTVENGSLTARFHFHHSAIPQLSRILGKSPNLKHLVKELYLHPTPGFISHLEHKNREFPLRVLVYSIPYSNVKGKIARSLFDEGGVAESAAVFSTSVFNKVIFYGTSETKTALKPVFPGSRIYEMLFEDMNIGIISVISNVMNSLGLKRFKVFFKKVDNSIRIIVLVQKFDAMKHISESFTYFGRADIPVELHLSRDYSDDVWETL